MKRRNFVKGMGLAVSTVLAKPGLSRPAPAHAFLASRSPLGPASSAEMKADVVIIGGGTGGFAAALAAARNGLRVIMTEETDWIGGQLTQQAVPPDEHAWIESFGATRTYREFRTRVREYYRRNYPLTAEARARWNLNPGNGGVSRLCHEPTVALAVLNEMLAPYVSGGRVVLLLQHKAMTASTQGDKVTAVTARSSVSGKEVTLTAPYIVDATELGDLLPMTGTEYVTGSESQKETGEPHASLEARPQNMQAFTWCLAVDYLEGEDHTIEKPEDYSFWRSYVPKRKPAWPGPLLSLTVTHWRNLVPYTYTLDPVNERIGSSVTGLWLYRRIADKSNFLPGSYPGDITIINWDQNDYSLGNIYEVSEEEVKRHLRGARQLTLSLLYWLQTEVPRPNGKMGWPGLRLRKDVVGTEDGLAKYPYIRESRRIKAAFTILEQHMGTDARVKATGKKEEALAAEPFKDSVGLGSYPIDLHASSGGDNFLTLKAYPFQIPLGALVPRRMENLLPACKNIGATHLTNGCCRLHPVEWNIGEAVGMLVSFCLARKTNPRQVRNSANLFEEFQKQLQTDGIETQWPKLTPR